MLWRLQEGLWGGRAECRFLEMVKSRVEIKELRLVLAFCFYQIRTLNRSPRKGWRGQAWSPKARHVRQGVRAGEGELS